MSLRTVARRSLGGRPGETAVYRRCFVKTVHRVLAAGYRRLDVVKLAKKEETAITGLLVDKMRALVESRACPRGAQHFAIHDDQPHSGALEGRYRPRIDIVVQRTGVGRQPRFHFEAKRLYATDSVSEYVGEDGMGCFLSGRYAKEAPDAGMLGYVQKDTPEVWATKLEKKLGARAGWTQHSLDVALPYSYRSSHVRQRKPFELFHVLLVCV